MAVQDVVFMDDAQREHLVLKAHGPAFPFRGKDHYVDPSVAWCLFMSWAMLSDDPPKPPDDETVFRFYVVTNLGRKEVFTVSKYRAVLYGQDVGYPDEVERVWRFCARFETEEGVEVEDSA